MGCGTSTPTKAKAEAVEGSQPEKKPVDTTPKDTPSSPKKKKKGEQSEAGALPATTATPLSPAGSDLTPEQQRALAVFVNDAGFANGVLKEVIDFNVEMVEIETMPEMTECISRHYSIITRASEVSFLLAVEEGGDMQLVDAREVNEPKHERTVVPQNASKSLVLIAAATNEVLNVANPAKDPRWVEASDNRAKVADITATLIIPVYSLPPPGFEAKREASGGPAFIPKLLALIQCFKHGSLGEKEFSKEALVNVTITHKHVSACIRDVTQYEIAAKAQVQNKILLAIAKEIFSEVTDTNTLVGKIIKHARQLLQAEGCSIFLVDQEAQELVINVFENKQSGINAGAELRFPMGKGISGHVATTGETVNIVDAYEDPRFNKAFDKKNNYRTKSILCMPIENAGDIVGVAQLINKIGLISRFSSDDEDLLRAFVAFCGIGLHNAMLYEKILKEEQRNRVAMEMVSYHVRVDEKELQALVKAKVPEKDSKTLKGMDYISFPVEVLQDDSSNFLVLRMFREFGFIEKFKINETTLASFVLAIRKNYRDVFYHNWMHALAVAHTFYVISRLVDLDKYLHDWEQYAIFVAALCHDIDHRGKNNAFQTREATALGQLYDGGSTMERHHFNHALSIIRQDRNNIFAPLDAEQWEKILGHIKHTILSTDLALHFPNLATFKKTLIGDKKVPYDFSNTQHRNMVTSLLMTLCDLGVICKPWDIQKKIAMVIYDEFFAQGDEEKARGETPIPMMDRELANIPDLQLGFIDHIAMPTYAAATEFIPELKPLLDGVRSNRDNWERVAKEKDGVARKEDDAVGHLPTL